MKYTGRSISIKYFFGKEEQTLNYPCNLQKPSGINYSALWWLSNKPVWVLYIRAALQQFVVDCTSHLVLHKSCFLLLEIYLSNCLVNNNPTIEQGLLYSTWKITVSLFHNQQHPVFSKWFWGLKCSMDGYFQIFRLTTLFNYQCYFSPSLPRIIESSL